MFKVVGDLACRQNQTIPRWHQILEANANQIDQLLLLFSCLYHCHYDNDYYHRHHYCHQLNLHLFDVPNHKSLSAIIKALRL